MLALVPNRRSLLLPLLAVVFLWSCDEFLDDGEATGVLSLPPLCDAAEVVCPGDYYIGQCPEWRGTSCPQYHPTGQIRNCTRITGELVIHGHRDARVYLPNLREVDEDFYVFENGSLSSLDLPCLTRVGDWFWVKDNPGLSACDVQDLRDGLERNPSRTCMDGNDGAVCSQSASGC
ncbi:MAG: hypothetical protein EA398_08920 [Deltaproteobacteria bacterium]|nr:MAG: hypothetical protein EA398_08920 [Deltaproteobacteria bacterium]